MSTMAGTGRVERSHSERPWFWSKMALISALLGVLYARILGALVFSWWSDPDLSYGLLIPPIALYIAWTRRESTLRLPEIPDNRGLVLVAAACLVFLIGKLGAELFLARFSLVMLLAALVWTFWGVSRLRVLSLPLLLLVTMIPLPVILYSSLAAPLQLLASRLATEVVQFLGTPAFRDGNIIVLPGMTLGVAEACSGLRSLSALAVLALLTGSLVCSRLRTRLVLLALAIPIAIGVNILRIAGTAILANYSPRLAVGFYHSFSGWLVFLMGFGLVFGAAKGLRLLLD